MRYLLSIILTTLSLNCLAQNNSDWIITTLGDTIHCDITKVSERSVYYKISGSGTKILSLDKVAEYNQKGVVSETGKVDRGDNRDCDYVTHDVNTFTKAKTIITQGIKLYSDKKSSTIISGAILDTYKNLKLSITTREPFNIREGDKFVLTTKDSVLTLKAVANSRSTHLTNTWSIKVMFAITQDELNYLISHKVSSTKLHYEKGTFENTIEERTAVKLQSELQCIRWD